MKRSLTLAGLFLASLAFAQHEGHAKAQEAPAPAKTVVEQAQARAAKENKAVFVSFHASWCGWCHKMEAVLNQKPVKAVMDKYYVSVGLVVMEREDKKSLENAGGMDYLIAAGGENEGIPYFYFTDAKGKILINSKASAKPNSNVGCPYAPEELVHFLKMLKISSPTISEAELKTVKTAFEAAAKKGG